jgi:hypothetical protein
LVVESVNRYQTESIDPWWTGSPASPLAQTVVPETAPKPLSTTAAAKPSFGRGLAEAVGYAFAPLLQFLRALGDHSLLLAQCAYWLFRRPFRARLFVDAMEYHGIGSLPIITLVGGFTGMVTALQSVKAFQLLKAEAFSGSAVGLALAVAMLFIPEPPGASPSVRKRAVQGAQRARFLAPVRRRWKEKPGLSGISSPRSSGSSE